MYHSNFAAQWSRPLYDKSNSLCILLDPRDWEGNRKYATGKGQCHKVKSLQLLYGPNYTAFTLLGSMGRAVKPEKRRSLR